MKTATVIYLLIVPLALMALARRWQWIEKLSPMCLLYLIGLAVGNCGLLGEQSLAVCGMTSELCIPLAIPLMLMGCSLRGFSVARALKVFLSGLLAVMATTIIGMFLFVPEGLSYADRAQLCAVMTGIYTGGIPNIGAIAKGVGLREELFLLVTSCDLIVTGIYLLFVIFLGRPLFRTLLRRTSLPACPADSTKDEDACVAVMTGWKAYLPLLALSIAIALASYGLYLLCNQSMTVLILALTTLAIAVSFIPAVGRQKGSFDIGLYFVYVFCLAIATQVDISQFHLRESLSVIGWIAFAVFGSVALQLLFARLLKIDADSTLTASVALINSPPFVPMVAAVLKNKEVVVLGIGVGLLGYMLGNYLGLAVYHVLMLLY